MRPSLRRDRGGRCMAPSDPTANGSKLSVPKRPAELQTYNRFSATGVFDSQFADRISVSLRPAA